MTVQKFRASDGLDIYYDIRMIEEPKGLVIILHGANEHKGRYKPLQKKLENLGYSSVCADRRGHGQSLSEDYPLGHMGELSRLLMDEREFFSLMKKKQKGQDIFIFSHSYGAILARLLLEYVDRDISGLVMTGTIPQKPQIAIPMVWSKFLTLGQDPRSRSSFLAKMGYGTNNKDLSWINSDPQKILEYVNDPLCRFHYSRQSYVTIFQANFRLGRSFPSKNPYLPILSLVGKKDPMVWGAKGHMKSLRDLKKKGYKNIHKVVFDTLHHEVFNSDLEKVYMEIDFFLKNSKK